MIATRRMARSAISVDGPLPFCRNIVSTVELLDTASGRVFARVR